MTLTPLFLDCPIPKIDYITVDINDIMLEMTPGGSNTKATVDHMEIAPVGEVIFSERFMQSFLAIFGIPRQTFNYFTPEEVIERITVMGKGDKVRIALEQHSDMPPRVLSAIRPVKPCVEAFDLWEMYKKLDIPDSLIKYNDGVVRSEHAPSMFKNQTFNLGGEDVVRRFVTDVPIDGWGSPHAYLQLTRLVCSNGMIGEAPAFKSPVNLGDNKTITKGQVVEDAIPTLRKFIEAHNNEEGFQILSDRIRVATETPASLQEFYKLNKILTKMTGLHRVKQGNKESDITLTMQRLVGQEFMKEYGLVSLDQIPWRKRSAIPIPSSVQDLINIASELATHRASADESKRLSAFIGEMIGDDNGFDLEGHDLQGFLGDDLFFTDPKDAHKNDEDKGIN